MCMHISIVRDELPGMRLVKEYSLVSDKGPEAHILRGVRILNHRIIA